MKKTFLIIAIALLSSIHSFSQTTTEDEYNYITIGYKTQVADQGGDLKKGYKIKDLGKWGINFRDSAKVTFKAFYREGILKPIAIMAIFSQANSTEYYCIPTMNAKDLWEKTLGQVSEGQLSLKNSMRYETLIYALMKLSSENIMAN